MVVADIEVVCRCQVQRVLTALRVNRKFGDLQRGWRELDEESPVKQLSGWRFSGASASSLLQLLLRIVRSPEFAGPSTFAALEAVHAVITAQSHVQKGAELASTLAEICNAICDCCFEETHAQTDEATAMELIVVLGFCITEEAGLDIDAFPASVRKRAFVRILSLWSHYKNGPTLRVAAQSVLQRALDFVYCHFEVQAVFLREVVEVLQHEVGPDLLAEKAGLYLQLLQRMMTHAAIQESLLGKGSHAHFLQDALPLILLRIAECFGTTISVLSLLLPLVNRTCWLCLENWASQNDGQRDISLGVLQVEASVSAVYLRAMHIASISIQVIENVGSLTVGEAVDLLVVLLEGLCDLLRPDVICALWYSFDADWRRPALLEPIIQSVVLLFQDSPSTERPIPAYVAHLSATVLSQIVCAFVVADGCPDENQDGMFSTIVKQWRRREAVMEAMVKVQADPTLARSMFETAGVLDFVEVSQGTLSSAEAAEDWTLKLAWLFRCCNHVPCAAIGDYFTQSAAESMQVFSAFTSTFDWSATDLDEAIRRLLQAFVLPMETEQIDKLISGFADIYCAKRGQKNASMHLEHPSAVYAFTFSILLLNADLHTPRLKKRMSLKDFITNNRCINDGKDIPEEYQAKIFESVQLNEITTPTSGSTLADISISRGRWEDLMYLIRSKYCDNALVTSFSDISVYVRALLERTSENLRTALESVLALDAGAYSDAISGLEALLHLTTEHQLQEANIVAEGLFFFGTELFHEHQRRGVLSRACLSLNALFNKATPLLTRLSTRQVHMLVCITIQFALYGIVEKVSFPAPNPTVARLLRVPTMAVDPPAGAVYGFFRKISTVSLRWLSFTDEDERTDSAMLEETPAGTTSDDAALQVVPEEKYEASTKPDEQGAEVGELEPPPDSTNESDATAMYNNPLRPQIEKAFEACHLDTFLCTLITSLRLDGRDTLINASPPDFDSETLQASCVALTFLSSIFLALRVPATSRVAKDQDLPFWPEESRPDVGAPQPLQLPKRALSLNVLDGFDVARLALRLTVAMLGKGKQDGAAEPWDLPVVQDFSVCSHVGLFHLLRRNDLCERSLKIGIVATFQVATILANLKHADNPVVSVGWPVRLVEVLVQRTENEPHILVPVSKLCMEAIRLFITDVSKHRSLDEPELWKQLLQLLLKAVPTKHRALWSAGRDSMVFCVQGEVWNQGVLWILGHPGLADCLGPEGRHSKRGVAPNAFWTWALGELAVVSEEMACGHRPTAWRILLDAYKTLVNRILDSYSHPDYSEDKITETTTPNGASQIAVDMATSMGLVRCAARAAAWSRIAISLLSIISPLIVRLPLEELELQAVPLLKLVMLDIRVTQVLGECTEGHHWATVTLEKLVTVLTGAASSNAPMAAMREAVSLVSKFFLQNLPALQKHERFSQLWLMVLNLMLLFVTKGRDNQNTELEEIGHETLKNLLSVLLDAKVLGFVCPKNATSGPQEPPPDVPVWWQMSWDSIEIFLPGFGEEFAKSQLRWDPDVPSFVSAEANNMV